MADDAPKALSAACYDCGYKYGAPGFPDLVVPDDVWRQISPTGDEGGLLCPSCLCARLTISGITCAGSFTSGPLVESLLEQQLRASRAETAEARAENRTLRNRALMIEGLAAEMAEGLDAALNMVEGDGRPPNWDWLRALRNRARAAGIPPAPEGEKGEG